MSIGVNVRFLGAGGAPARLDSPLPETAAEVETELVDDGAEGVAGAPAPVRPGKVNDGSTPKVGDGGDEKLGVVKYDAGFVTFAIL